MDYKNPKNYILNNYAKVKIPSSIKWIVSLYLTKCILIRLVCISSWNGNGRFIKQSCILVLLYRNIYNSI